MSNIILQKIDPQNKIKIIQAIREVTGCGLTEGQSAVEQVEKGKPFILQNISKEQASDIAKKFESLGCSLTAEEEKHEIIGESYTPIFPSESASCLDRQKTMELLLEIRKIAKPWKIATRKLLHWKARYKQNKIWQKHCEASSPKPYREKSGSLPSLRQRLAHLSFRFL